jgi:hypothetical protein
VLGLVEIHEERKKKVSLLPNLSVKIGLGLELRPRPRLGLYKNVIKGRNIC